MNRLDNLPDDVLIQIFYHVRILDLLALRRTCRTMNATFTHYGYIIAPAIVRQTMPHFMESDHNVIRTIFPDYPGLLLQPPTKDKPIMDWIRLVFPYELAMLMTSRQIDSIYDCWRKHSLSQWNGHMLLREQFYLSAWVMIAIGWRIMKELSRISKEAHSTPIKDLASADGMNLEYFKTCRTHQKSFKTFVSSTLNRFQFFSAVKDSTSQLEMEHYQLRERLAFNRRMRYISELRRGELRCWHLMWSVLAKVFRIQREPIDLDSIHLEGPAKRCFDFIQTSRQAFHWHIAQRNNAYVYRDSWIYWALLHEGPALFWTQWCCRRNEKDYVRDRLLSLWTQRKGNPERVELEHRSASIIIDIIDGKAFGYHRNKTIAAYILDYDYTDRYPFAVQDDTLPILQEVVDLPEMENYNEVPLLVDLYYSENMHGAYS